LDGDEVFALVVSLAIAAVGAVRWYADLFRVTSFASPRGHRMILGFFPLLCIALVYGVLVCCSAHEVREDAIYDVLFLAGAGAWLGVAGVGLQLIGICPRDDAIETRNSAAVMAICGTWLGATLCYAGANIGEGATIWMTFVPAAAATGALLVLLLLLELFSAVSESITLDRDCASALRLAGFLVAAGLILGRSVAGDFHSWNETSHDFLVQGWPALPALAATVVLHRLLRPTPLRPEGPILSAGLAPAAAMIMIAVIDLLMLGLPEHLHKGG
jgi:uncharacterized membrane protein YjfL (UPF0719 family)